jgi:mediator of RNA polymerase II transcription subunit 12
LIYIHGQLLDRPSHDLLTFDRLNALLRLVVSHGAALVRDATHAHQTALVFALKSLLVHTTLDLYPAIVEHVFDVASILSDYISDDVRNHTARFEDTTAGLSLSDFILGVSAPVDGWLVLTKPVNLPSNPQTSSQPVTPMATQTQASPYQSPQLAVSNPATPQQRYFNQQHQQRQQFQQAQQAQQSRTYPQYPQHTIQPTRQLSGGLQRTPSFQGSASPLQQMQQMHGLAQQRATQPSPVHSQRPTLATSQGVAGGSGGVSAGPSKLQTSYTTQQRESRQFPFVQPRWEILAESSGNPNLNETAINLCLFGARKV